MVSNTGTQSLPQSSRDQALALVITEARKEDYKKIHTTLIKTKDELQKKKKAVVSLRKSRYRVWLAGRRAVERERQATEQVRNIASTYLFQKRGAVEWLRGINRDSTKEEIDRHIAGAMSHLDGDEESDRLEDLDGSSDVDISDDEV